MFNYDVSYLIFHEQLYLLFKLDKDIIHMVG